MKRQTVRMGMPVTIDMTDSFAKGKDITEMFAYLLWLDNVFSTYKQDSMVSQLNMGYLQKEDYPALLKLIISYGEQTKQETNGYFDMVRKGFFDPSGLVKGYAISQVAKKLQQKGYANFSVTIAGDTQVVGNKNDRKWKVGIRSPFNEKEIIKVLSLANHGVATSGNYLRKNHIYNPYGSTLSDEVVSMTVVAKDIYDADRMATASFAMGTKGITFLEEKQGYEAYMITKDKKAYYTSGFLAYCQ